MFRPTTFCLLLLFLSHFSSFGDPMQSFLFSGRLSSASGVSLAGTTVVSMTAKLYANQSGGTASYIQVFSAVEVNEGFFSIQIGPALPDLVNNSWLELTVQGSTLSPRQQLPALPFAISALDSQTLSGMSTTDLISMSSTNPASGFQAFSAGGRRHDVSGTRAFAGGGEDNVVTGANAFTLGGRVNQVYGDNSGVLGGSRLTIEANNTLGFNGTGQSITVTSGMAGSAIFMVHRFGIGTATPNHTLEVNGSVRANTLEVQHNVVAQGFRGDGSQLTNLPSNSVWEAIDTTGVLLSGNRNISGHSSNQIYGFRHVNLGFLSRTGALGQGQVSNTVSGGSSNVISASYSTIGGGRYNEIIPSSNHSFSANYATVGGGERNINKGMNATIGGGKLNVSSGDYTTISGGDSNVASEPWATVAGGSNNQAQGWYSSVGGGKNNAAMGFLSSVAGGQNNTAAGVSSSVAGGEGNVAEGHYSSVLGGKENIVLGDRSAIIGGTGLTLTGNYSLGFRATNSTTGVTRADPNMVYFLETGLCVSSGISDTQTGCGDSLSYEKGHIYATKFHGDGSMLTGISGGATNHLISDNTSIEIDTTTTGSPEHIHVTVDSVETLFISSAGLGVGISFPSQALEVAGTIAADFFVGDGSGLSGVLLSGENISAPEVSATTFTDGIAHISGGDLYIGNVEASGTVTASAFVGDGSGLSGILLSGNNISAPEVSATTITDGIAHISGGDLYLGNVEASGTVTASAFVGDGSGLSGILLSGDNISAPEVSATTITDGIAHLSGGELYIDNIEASGTVTASAFVGDGSGLTGVHLAGQNISAPVIFATTFVGDGSSLTGVHISGQDVSAPNIFASTFVAANTLSIGSYEWSSDGSLTVGNVDASGTVTASYFHGDGSALLNLPTPSVITSSKTTIEIDITPPEHIHLYADGVEKMFISSTGVGIGVSFPSNALEVSGTISADEFIGTTLSVTDLTATNLSGDGSGITNVLHPGDALSTFNTLTITADGQRAILIEHSSAQSPNTSKISIFNDGGSKVFEVDVEGDIFAGALDVLDVAISGHLRHATSTLQGTNSGTHVNLATLSQSGAAGASHAYISITGGQSNQALNDFASIGAGQKNTASGYNSRIGGGEQNIAAGNFSYIGGGGLNETYGALSSVVGGELNTASGDLSHVGGGYGNVVQGEASVISGGDSNTVSGRWSAIPGGSLLKIESDDTFGYNGTGASHVITSGMNNSAIFMVSRFGVGTTTPHVNYIADFNGNVNVRGQIFENGQAVGGGSSVFTDNTTNIVYTSGNVGLGIGDPEEQLVVGGKLRMSATTDTLGLDGTIRWTGSDLEVLKSGNWESLTEGGSTTTTDELRYFSEFQTIATSGAQDWEAFTIGSDTYLAVAHNYDGTNFELDSKIYKWDGTQFSLHQSIASSGAADWESFEIGADTYLALANHQSSGSIFQLDSKIYKWNGSQFAEHQSIPTSGAHDMESFVIGSNTYLAVGYHRDDGGTYNLNSEIFVWNSGNSQFVVTQTIATNGAADWHAFTIGADTYLAVANQYDGQTRALNSVIYKWNGSSFVSNQSISTVGAFDWESLVIGSDTYLAVAQYNNDTVAYSQNSTIYKWDGTQFKEFQSIATDGITDWEPFEIGDDTFLAAANQYDGTSFEKSSKLYQWNGTEFVQVQAISTKGNLDWAFFTIDSTNYLAVANKKNDSSVNIDSVIYKAELETGSGGGSGSGNFSISGNDTILDTGFLGLGTNAPEQQLDVKGKVHLAATTDTSGTDGTLRWTGSDLEVLKAGNWTSLTSSGSEEGTSTTSSIPFDEYALLFDSKTSGTHGGSSAVGWQTRELNTIGRDDGGIVQLSSNQFTLQTGSYYIRAIAPGKNVGRHKLALYNSTASQYVETGPNQHNASNSGVLTLADFSAALTLNTSAAFEIHHYTEAAATNNGLGEALALGIDEIYTRVEIWKMDTTNTSSPFDDYAKLLDIKTQGTAGGASVVGWQTRDLNTIRRDDSGMVQLNSNQFTLGPGKYHINADAPIKQVGSHRIALYDSTNSQYVVTGGNEFVATNKGAVTRGGLSASISVSANTTYEIQHYIQSARVTDGLGIDNNAGDEVYTRVEIWRQDTSNGSVFIPYDEHYASIIEASASGTNGGTATAGWQTRTLNTIDKDENGIVQLNSNQFTLKEGNYFLTADAPAFSVGEHIIALYDSVSGQFLSTGVGMGGNPSSITRATLSTSFSLQSSGTFEIRHRVSTTRAADGLGKASGSGSDEIYTKVQIWKMDTAGTSTDQADSSSFIADSDGDTTIDVEDTGDSDRVLIKTNGIERMTIESTGNVGIGITNPSELLEVAGNIKSAGTVEAQYFRHTTPVMFRVHRTTDQSISTTNETTVDFTAEAFDLGNDFDLTSDAFTAPVSGVYWFSGTARDTGGTDGQTFRVKFKVDGVVDMQHYCRWVSINDISCRVEGLIQLNTNQKVTFIVHHDISGGISLKGNSGSTFFQGRLVEPTN